MTNFKYGDISLLEILRSIYILKSRQAERGIPVGLVSYKKYSIFGEKPLYLECKMNVSEPKCVSLLISVAMET